MTSEGMSSSRRRERPLMGAQLADEIREYVTENNLRPGDPLPSESDLAETYGVGQRVVRDALRMLTRQGLIVTSQGKRAVVGELRPVAVQEYFGLALDADAGGMAELMELRTALESRAAALAAERITDDQLKELQLLFNSITLADDPRTRARADVAFHTAIVAAAQNRFFDGVVEALVEAQLQAREREQTVARDRGASHSENDREHQALLEALRLRSPTLAEHTMRTHLEAVQRRIVVLSGSDQ